LANPQSTKKWAEKSAVFHDALIKYTDGETEHQTILLRAQGEHSWYKRLDVASGLSDRRETHPTTVGKGSFERSGSKEVGYVNVQVFDGNF